jgi:hypothetical protein
LTLPVNKGELQYCTKAETLSADLDCNSRLSSF